MVGGEIVSQGNAPTPDVVQFFARHLGLVEPVPAVAFVTYTDSETVMASLAEQVTDLLGRDTFTHVGVATLPHPDGHLAVLVMTHRGLELTAVERTRATGALLLSGTLIGELQNPEVVLLHPDGHTQRAPAGAGPRFQVRLLLPSTGVYSVEVLARGSAGITVLANFPVYVDEAVPTRLAISAADSPGIASAEDVQQALVERIAEERVRAGAPPLELHAGLAAVAEAHCRDMVTGGFVGHDSPTTGTPAMRITAAGLASGLMLENVGRGYSASELHSGLMDSPGHRANIVDARVTHLGIAVVAVQDGDRTAFLVTQIFTQMTARVDTASAPAQLVQAINEGRRARRAGPVESDELLGPSRSRGCRGVLRRPHADRARRDGPRQRRAAPLRHRLPACGRAHDHRHTHRRRGAPRAHLRPRRHHAGHRCGAGQPARPAAQRHRGGHRAGLAALSRARVVALSRGASGSTPRSSRTRWADGRSRP
jgi:uncharacterized protein YkwD